MSANVEKVYQELTDKIIEQIESGMADPTTFTLPWTGAGALMSPFNPVTEYHFTAGNRFILYLTSMMNGVSEQYATYKQWAAMSRHSETCVRERGNRPEREFCDTAGCQLVNVRKGEKAMATLIRPIFKKLLNEAGVEVDKLVAFSTYYAFNESQVHGYTRPVENPIAHNTDEVLSIDAAFAYARQAGADLELTGSGGAMFNPRKDQVVLPSGARWHSAEAAWSTMFHEMTHWTGHPSRLNRPVPAAMCAGESYTRQDMAFEELVAELGAAFAMSSTGHSSTPRDDHAPYLASWLELLRDQPDAMYKAASKAEAGVKQIMQAHTANGLVAAL